MLRKIPNILTIGRILIVPFFVLAFYLPGFYGDLTALILLVMDGTIKNYEVIAAIIILTREILISGLREFLAKGTFISFLPLLPQHLQLILFRQDLLIPQL